MKEYKEIISGKSNLFKSTFLKVFYFNSNTYKNLNFYQYYYYN